MQGVNNQLQKSMMQSSDSRGNAIHENSSRLEKEANKEPTDTKEGQLEKSVINAIEEANKKIQGNDKEFQFSVHEETKQIMVKVIDKENGKILKEFPPEKILDMVAKMCETAGIFVDERR